MEPVAVCRNSNQHPDRSYTGEAHFCAPAFSYVLRSKKGPLLCHTVGRHRLGPEHVQISTPETWPHPNTMRASGARALGGMFGNARATHTACPKNTGAKTLKCWDKKSCAGSAGAKKVYAGHASHTLAHCFQEMSACMIADI